MRRRYPDSRSQYGATAVEFGLALPIFLAIVFGIVEFGTAIFRQHVMTSAVREMGIYGVIAGSSRPTESQIRSFGYDYLDSMGLEHGKSSITVTGAGGGPGDPLDLRIEYPSELKIVSAFSSGLPHTITLQAGATYHLE